MLGVNIMQNIFPFYGEKKLKAKHVNKTSQEAAKVTDLLVSELATESREEPFLYRASGEESFLHWVCTPNSQHDDSPSIHLLQP